MLPSSSTARGLETPAPAHSRGAALNRPAYVRNKINTEECQSTNELNVLTSDLDAHVSDLRNGTRRTEALEYLVSFVVANGRTAEEPTLIAALGPALEAIASEDKNMHHSAEKAAWAIVEVVNPFAYNLVFPALLQNIDRRAKPIQIETALNLLAFMALKCPKAVALRLAPSLLLSVTDQVRHAEKSISMAATACMSAIVSCAGNEDLKPFEASLARAMESQELCESCLRDLANIDFTHAVDTASLAVLLPVLRLGFHIKSDEVKTICFQIVAKMMDQVEDPAELLPMTPTWLFRLSGVAEDIHDPESRCIACSACYKVRRAAQGFCSSKKTFFNMDPDNGKLILTADILREGDLLCVSCTSMAGNEVCNFQVGKDATGVEFEDSLYRTSNLRWKQITFYHGSKLVDTEWQLGQFPSLTITLGAPVEQQPRMMDIKAAHKIVDSIHRNFPCSASSKDTANHVASLVEMAANMRSFDPETWLTAIGCFPPYASFAMELCFKAQNAMQRPSCDEEEDIDGEDLYRGTVTAVTLAREVLSDAKLHLKRNKFYGLVGRSYHEENLLFEAMAGEDTHPTFLPEFPPIHTVRRIRLHTDPSHAGETGLQWALRMCNDTLGCEPPITESQILDCMACPRYISRNVQTAELVSCPLNTHPAHHQYKMQLCVAELANVDLLIFSEPRRRSFAFSTAEDIAWFENWLEGFQGCCICNSRRMSFLNKLCTHLIEIKGNRLRTFKGVKGRCLKQLLHEFSELRSYFEDQ